MQKVRKTEHIRNKKGKVKTKTFATGVSLVFRSGKI